MVSLAHPKPTREPQTREWDHPYLDWVRMQPCIITGSAPSEAAHVRVAVSTRTGGLLPRRNGIAMLTAIPLSPEMHRTGRESIHNLGERAFEERFLHPHTLAELVATHFARYLMTQGRPR